MDRRIKRVLTLLEGRLKDPPSIEQLADDVGLSPSRLAHLFRQEMGRSIQSYLLEQRLLAAAKAVVETHEQISQIAYSVGFGDVSNFNHAFKRRFGMSPRQYRRAHEDSNNHSD